jgi:multimeric flavodoxin WrbA
MKVLGVCGSPRAGGNADVLLDKALEGARARGAETEKVVLNNLKFSPCQACERVKDDGSCIVEDEMQPLYKKFAEADAIIVSSPIFFGSLSAQTKMMIDRFQCVWRARHILKKDIFAKRKKGAFISVEASTREDFFANAKSIVRNLFATVNADYQEELFCPGLDKKGGAAARPELLEKAFELGQRLALEIKNSKVKNKKHK